MTIRIDRIERRDGDGHYVWFIGMKGLYGDGVYCCLQTGEDGYGLSYATHELDSWTELLAADRFYAHESLNAEPVAHRVAACLVCIGWGPEFYDDRESLTAGGPVATLARARRKASS